MSKLLIGLATGIFLATASVVVAAPNGQPFQALWDVLDDLQEQIDNIDLLPGPPGEPGEPGRHGQLRSFDGPGAL